MGLLVLYRGIYLRKEILDNNRNYVNCREIETRVGTKDSVEGAGNNGRERKNNVGSREKTYILNWLVIPLLHTPEQGLSQHSCFLLVRL